MSDAENSGRSSDLVLQTVKYARKHGFIPIPLVKKSKAALIKDYQNPEYKGENDDFWLKGDYGVGVLLGPNRSGPIDIDLDCPEAIALAPYLLPKTSAIFGRPGKPNSHYIYRVGDPSAISVTFRDKVTNKNIVEVRGDATKESSVHQTVFPGSLHEDTGELINWANTPFPEPAFIEEFAYLVRRNRLMSIGVIILRHIWTDGFRNDPTLPLAGVMAKFGWTRDEVHDLFHAMAEVENKHDKARMKTIRITFDRFELGQPVAGVPKLREFLGASGKEVVNSLLEIMGSNVVRKIEEYNEKYACVMVNGQKILMIDVEPTKPPIFMEKQGFIDWNAEDSFTGDDGKRHKWPVVWLNSSSRTKYPGGVDFIPGVNELHPDFHKYEGKFNLWNGWAFDINEKPEGGSCDAWLEILYTVLANNDEEGDWVVNWLAHILRDPMDLPSTALVLKGEQGVGKSLLLNYFGMILGEYYFAASSDEHIVGRFTSHMARTLLLHSEEALYAGNPKHKNILKALISGATRTWEAKNVDAKQIKNYLRFAASSNDARPVPSETGDRRYVNLDSEDRKPSQALIDKAVEEMQGNGPKALAYYLTQEIDYDRKKAHKIIKTEASLRVILAGLSPVQRWLFEKLDEGKLLSTGFEWAKDEIKNPWPSMVASRALYFDFLTWLHGPSAGRSTDNNWNDQIFRDELMRLVGDIPKKQRSFKNPHVGDDMDRSIPVLAKRLGTGRMNAYVEWPDLNSARDRFQKICGSEFKIEWAEPVQTDTPPSDAKAQEYKDRADEKGY